MFQQVSNFNSDIPHKLPRKRLLINIPLLPDLYLLLSYLKQHLHSRHEVRHLCERSPSYQTGNDLEESVKSYAGERELVPPACRLGSRTARCAGGWCGVPAGWRGTAPASSACRRECPACEKHPPASFGLGGEPQLK